MSGALKGSEASDAKRLIRELIFELAPNQSPPAIENPHLIDDLQYQSLALLELAFTLEDEFGIPPIDQQTAQKISTVSDVLDYVLEQIDAVAQRGSVAQMTAQTS